MEGTSTLVGMLDSPFVRRVAVTLDRYGFTYENLPLRTMGDAAQFAAYSPLKRAPTLILPTGEALFDSHLIIAHLDEMVTPGVSLLPVSAEERLVCRQVIGIAAGLADKAVSAVYERSFHSVEQRSARLMTRIKGQIDDSLAWLEQIAPSEYLLFPKGLSHADVMVGTALCFAIESSADLVNLDDYPTLLAYYERICTLPEFKRTYLPIELPA